MLIIFQRIMDSYITEDDLIYFNGKDDSNDVDKTYFDLWDSNGPRNINVVKNLRIETVSRVIIENQKDAKIVMSLKK